MGGCSRREGPSGQRLLTSTVAGGASGRELTWGVRSGCVDVEGMGEVLRGEVDNGLRGEEQERVSDVLFNWKPVEVGLLLVDRVLNISWAAGIRTSGNL